VFSTINGGWLALSERVPRLVPFALAAGVVLLDRITKGIIKSHIGLWDRPVTVIPGCFNIVHTENPGIAFGLLADASGLWRNVLLIGFASVVLLVITIILLRGGHSVVLRSGLALVLGGAFGNLYDRIVHGSVTDFIEVYAGQHYFPAFNVADSAISVGAGLLLLDMWLTRERKSASASPECFRS
jgi:signal peptidase II